MKLKKVCVLLLSVVMIFAVMACGNDKDSNVSGGVEETTQEDMNNKDDASDELVENEDSKDDQSENNRITRRLQKWCPIYYDYSDAYILEAKTAVDVIEWVNPETNHSDEILIGLYDDVLEEFEGNLEDVIDYVNKSTFFVALSGAGSGGGLSYGLFGQEIEVTSSEKVKVAGYDSMKYTGTILNAPGENESWTCNVYGYTFLIDDAPYTVLGFVTTKEQEQSMIDEMIAEVDAIANSIRTEE